MAERIERAKQAFIQRKFDAAISEYGKAVRELPEDQQFVAYSNRGAALMNTGKVKDAIKSFRKALELNPEHYESMHNMGVAFAAAKQFDKALECFEKTLEYAPYFYASHCGKSEALASLGRFEEAADAAKDGIQEDPNEPIAHADLGFAYLKQGRFEEAVKAYERAHALKDRSSETARLHGVALSELALECETTNDLDRAVELYHKALEKHESAQAFHNIGILMARQGHLHKAKAAFGKALKLDPEFFATNAALGVLHANEKRYDLALVFLEKARDLDPSHVENLYNLGVVQMKEGSHEEALRQFRAVLRIDSSNPDARLAMQLLRTAIATGGGGGGGGGGGSSSGAGGGSASSHHHRSSRSASRSRSSASRGAGAGSSSASRSASRSAKQRSASQAAKKRSASRSHRSKKTYTVEELQANPPPPGVDLGEKEMYLKDSEFVELFGMSKEEFVELPYWKQTLEKKRYNLF